MLVDCVDVVVLVVVFAWETYEATPTPAAAMMTTMNTTAAVLTAVL
jgi:hypothetical protein